jgi:Tol biopolymer transport system component
LLLGESTTGDTGRYETVDWSDNGMLISQANRGAGTNVWMVDPADSRPKKLTDGLFVDRSPVWIHGVNAVAFASNRGGSSGLWRYDLGTSQYKRLVSGAGYIEAPQCSPDGKWLVYTTWKANQPSIWRVASTGGVPHRIFSEEARHPVFSPDGKRIAAEVLSGPRDTEWLVTIFSADTDRELQRLSTIPSGARLAWYPDGQALTYIVTDDRGVSNIWRQPLSGKAPSRITSFQENQIFDYGWSRDGEKLACLRGRAWSDAYLLQRKP